MAIRGVKTMYWIAACAALGGLLSGAPARAAQVQEQVPIPGLTVEESVRLESASDKLKELAVQRQKKNEVRRDEIEKLIGQVEEAAKSQDDLRYRAARERLISYIFAANNKDHALFELGKLEQAQSRPEGALARFQELIDRHPYSPLANEASIRIKALAAQQEPTESEEQQLGEKDTPAETEAKEPGAK